MGNFTLLKNRQKRSKWFENHRIIGTARKNIREFIELAEANNADDTKIKFIVDEKYSVDQIKGTKFVLYNDGLEKSGFIMSSRPGVPYPISIVIII